MNKFVFEEANRILNKEEKKVKTINIKEYFYFTSIVILVFSFFYIPTNEKLVLFLFDESLKHEVTAGIINMLDVWINTFGRMIGTNNESINEIYEYKQLAVGLELAIINIIYATILAIIHEDKKKAKYKDCKL